jgi:PAS domain S-box-containing protein
MNAAGRLQDSALLVLCAMLQAGIFTLDLLLPPGVAVGILYTAPLLLGLWFPKRSWVLVLASTGAALIVAGHFLPMLPAPGDDAWKALANRALALVTLFGATLLILRQLRAATALRESETNLRAAQRLTGSGHYQLAAGRETRDQWSDRALDILGRTATDQPSRQEFIEQHVDPADREKVREAFASALNEGTPFEVEFRIRRSDGSTRYVESAGEPLELRAGKVARIIGSILDVTGRKRTEESLQARKARLRSILETAPEAIITINAAGIVESFSTAAEHLFGYAADEVIGKNVSLLMPSPDRDRHDSYLQRYLTTGEARIIGIGRVVQGRRKDGTIVPVELAVGEIELKGERIFTGFLRDLTARQHMEQELRQAQKMEAIGQLAGGIAHDFNNLLTVILGNLEMLQKRLKADERQQVLIDEMRETAELGAQLTDRLLTFGRRQSLQPRPVDVGQLMAETSTLLRRTLGEAIDVHTSVKSDLSMALADPGQLQNAMLNLALNARDAMPRGGTLVMEAQEVELDADYVQTHPQARLGRHVMVAVSDTGIGMPRDVLERAFEPFFTTKGVRAGTGLGLSMVYGFVTQTGGHVHLYSEVGLGTTVRMYLPIARDVRVPEAPADEAADALAGRGETILVVEDDAGVRRVSVRRVKELGYRVVEAENGPAALQCLEAGAHIDLLFTDVIMPGGMTGVELAQRVQRQFPSTAVLLTSGYAEPKLLQFDGIEEWTLLKKPYTAANLSKTLRDVLDRKQSA